ncbi:MAG: AAA family ATPase [Patescibacteria group bacterium]
MKTIIMMNGFPGTGKTTAAIKIQETLNGVGVVRRDSFVKQGSLVGVHTLEQYSQSIKDTHEVFYQEIERLLSDYDIVVLDSVFRSLDLRERVYTIVQKINACCFLIKCVCGREEHLKRLREKIKNGEWIFDSPAELLSLYEREAQALTDDELRTVNFLQLDTQGNRITQISIKSDEASVIARALIKALT